MSSVLLAPSRIRHCLSVIFKSKPGIPDADWAAFKNGCFAVFSQTNPPRTRETLINEARQAIKYYEGIGTGAGSSYGDFTSTQQESKFPDGTVWIIQFDHPSIMSLVVMDNGSHDLDMQAGLLGRMARIQDADAPEVVATSLDEE